MGAQIMRTSPRITFSEHVFLPVDAALKAAKKYEGLKSIFPMGKVDR
jgi:hypothetical protein